MIKQNLSIKVFLLVILSLQFAKLETDQLFAQNNFYVSNTGSDANVGTISEPWETIQHAANSVSGGSIVNVRGGEYKEAITINVSGSESGGYITFQNYQNEQVIIDGTEITVPPDFNGLFLIANKNYIIIKRFELRNYSTAQVDVVPSGIFITGTSHHIKIRNNKIHKIEHTAQIENGSDAHGIAVYGTSGTNSINNLLIDGNELYNLILGSSEAMVLNGNVELFTISNNIVRDANNIAIDCIGFEGTASQYDQARNGEIIDNTIYNISSYGNPAYGNVYAAGGIYIDGGTDIIIDRNIIHNADIGIELASEHNGKATSNITVRNNLIYDNNIAGVAMGGYDTNRGSTENCRIINNTFYNNDTKHEYNGELWLQFDVRDSEIRNNIFYCNNQGVLISNPYTQNTNNVVDYNLYYSPTGENNSTWVWKNEEYYEFSTYKSETGNDANGLFDDPLFVDIPLFNFRLKNSSLAIREVDNTVNAGSYDLDKESRIENGVIDLGSYKFRNTVLLKTKIFLEGTFDPNTNLMLANLNVPTTSPYSENQRTISVMPDGIVDWVLVQLRKILNENAIVSKSLLLREDGLIVNDDATSGVVTLNGNDANYYVIIKHRNHLAVMSKDPIPLNSTTSTLYDFTISSEKFYGNGGATQLEP